GDNGKLVGIRLQESRNDRIILVRIFLLLRVIQNPLTILRILAILDPDTGQARVVHKMKAQWTRDPERPTVVKGSDEYRGTPTKVGQTCSGFSEHPIGLS